MKRSLLATASLTAATLALAACGSGSNPSATGSSTSGSGEKVEVVAAFYPLEYLVTRVGGDKVTVTNLTKPGVEPHDLELTPQDVAKVSSAKLAVYQKGMQAAVDKAVAEQGAKGAFDVSPAAELTIPAVADAEEGHDHGGHEHGKESATPAPAASAKTSSTTTAAADHDHDHGAMDPHYWTDPVRYGKVGKAIATKLGEIDPANKSTYEANADALVKDLDALHADFTSGLKSCTNKELVTSHAAFAYLANRYGFDQEPIAGVSPDQEPEPAKLAEITDFVKDHKVTTIYTETLVSPAIAQTIAKSTGAQTAVLDPIEGITDTSAGKNYLEVMRSNLATLQKGQSCK